MDEFAGLKSFVYGKSTRNQHIESIWAILRKRVRDWWIKFLKDMRDSGVYCDSDIFDTKLLHFCNAGIIINELQTFMSEWNSHKIYVKRNSECVNGKPDVLFHMPEMHGIVSYGCFVSDKDVEFCKANYTTRPKENGCSENFVELVKLLMPRIDVPHSASEALMLYKTLRDKIASYQDS